MHSNILCLYVLVKVVAALQLSLSPVQANEPQENLFPSHSSEVTGLAFVPDSTRLISTSLRGDRISNIVAGEGATKSIGADIDTISGARSHAVAVSPDGTQVAIAGFRATTMYDLKTRQEHWRMITTADEYSPPFVMALAFSPDGRQLATSGSSAKIGGPHGYKAGLVTIRDAKSGQQIHRYEDLSHAAGSIAFSPNGKLFAIATYGAGGELPEPGEESHLSEHL